MKEFRHERLDFALTRDFGGHFSTRLGVALFDRGGRHFSTRPGVPLPYVGTLVPSMPSRCLMYSEVTISQRICL